MDISVIPQPKNISFGENHIVFGNIPENGLYENAVKVYNNTRSALGFSRQNATRAAILTDASLGCGEYVINCTDGFNISVSSEKGLHNAFATLLQLEAQSADGRIEVFSVHDKPDCEYRGIMIDVARVWHPVEYILAYIDLCRMYKFSTLHLHFTDDNAFTLPIKSFPKLSSGKSFSEEDIRRINGYASMNGIEIMPELDVPGHSAVMRYVYPEIFGDNGVIPFTEKAVDAVKTVIGEVCGLFPASQRIHLGADEACIDNWLSDKASMDFAKQKGIFSGGEGRPQEKILAAFIAECAEEVHKQGRTPVVWEGFPKETNAAVPEYVEVCAFETFYQTADSLLSDGFNVINCSWIPNYLVTPEHRPQIQDCFDWDVYSYRPISSRSPYYGNILHVPENGSTLGGQFLSWGDFGVNADAKKHIELEMNDILERVPATAENLWNVSKQMTFEEFENARLALAKTVKKLIAYRTEKAEF